MAITRGKLYEENDPTTSCFVAFAVHESGFPSGLLIVVGRFDLHRLRFAEHTGGDVFGDELDVWYFHCKG